MSKVASAIVVCGLFIVVAGQEVDAPVNLQFVTHAISIGVVQAIAIAIERFIG